MNDRFAIHEKHNTEQHDSNPHAHVLLVLRFAADHVERVEPVSVDTHRPVATVWTRCAVDSPLVEAQCVERIRTRTALPRMLVANTAQTDATNRCEARRPEMSSDL